MKKSKNIYCILLFAVLGITGCSEEKMAPLPEPVPTRQGTRESSVPGKKALQLLLFTTHPRTAESI